MAGIGFVLRRLTRQDNLIGVAQSFVYSALVSSGPFLVTVIAMGALNLAAHRLLDNEMVETFRLVTIYNFSISLIITGPLLLVLTRYLADRIFLQQAEEAPGMLVGALGLSWAVQAPVVLWLYFWHTEMAVAERLAASVHYFLVSGIWVVSVFLSALKDYRAIGYSFAGGMAVGFLAGWQLMEGFGGAGLIGGFALGLATVFFALVLRVMLEYPYRILRPFAFLGYFRRYWDLAAFGLTYNTAIWIDKFVLWLAPDAVLGAVGLVSNPPYDGAMFLAHLTTVPALAIFVVSIETEFFERYQKFYRDIQAHATYAQIERNRLAIVASLSTSGRNILILQAILAAVAIMASPALFGLLYADARQIGIFRLGVLGSLFQILFVFLTIVLAYFDLRRRLVQVSIAYLLLNAGLSWMVMQWGFNWYGYGFFLASAGAFLLALVVCAYELGRLPYLTFVKNNASIR